MGNPHSECAKPEGCAPITKLFSSSAWIEGQAEEQLRQVASWPGMLSVAAFPDLHPGRHGPVGAAFMADRIYPQLVGPDIGCGMALFRLSLPRRKLRLDKVGKKMGILDDALDQDEARAFLDELSIPSSAEFSQGLGSIGGGNHFCEIQEVVSADAARGSSLSRGDLCLLIHTGSRGHGYGVFRSLEEQWAEGFSPDSPHGKEYITRHNEAVQWARVNRLAVASRIAEALRTDIELVTDAAHNTVQHHQDGWLHRKGAAAPDCGLAPLAGSRDDYSYLMEVQDNPQALWSTSHGAGRRYDRASMH